MITDPETLSEKQLDVLVEPKPKLGALEIRPFSAGTLTLCRMLNLTMILGTADDKAALSDFDKQRQITTFLFIQSQPVELVKAAVKVGRKDMERFVDDYLLDFEMSLPVDVMASAIADLAESIDHVGIAQFEAKPRETGAPHGPKETPPPNS